MRHMYHQEGMTDLDKMRQEARKNLDLGEEVIIHHHPHSTTCDLEVPKQTHETFQREEVKAPYPEEDQS